MSEPKTTEEQIRGALKEHAALIEKSQREKWLMLPIPLEEKAFWLRMDALLKRRAAWVEQRGNVGRESRG